MEGNYFGWNGTSENREDGEEDLGDQEKQAIFENVIKKLNT